ncbi:MAG: DUF4169 family protein [Aquamicrobium sp.]|uniref:DUF4169 family protein n=1 Tax=Aquamicrobium sp. TaxID=1872579 RepID=UPI00349E4B31|nr:DUF4169 family protein [Aquamicrobium sp.]
MAEIVNRRAMRKRRDRAEKERKAEENRALHGRTKGEKNAGTAERERALSRLDGHRIERAAPESDGTDETP